MYQLRSIPYKPFYTECQKTGSVHYCKLQQGITTKHEMFSHSRENANRGHAESIIIMTVQNDVPLHGHKPGDVVFIRQLPH